MKAARKKAIDYYTLIVNDYPNYPQLDEVLYYLAYEYEQANDLENARKVYYDLIKKAPQSKYIPNAYLAFGELFFNEAQGDPVEVGSRRAGVHRGHQVPAAGQQGLRLRAGTSSPTSSGTRASFDKALNAFKKTIEFGVAVRAAPERGEARRLARAATSSRSTRSQGDPAQAYNFLHNLSGDAAGSNEKTFKMMDDLGQNYLDTGHYPEAIVALQRPDDPRQAASATASTRRTSPKRRWR